MKGNYSQTTFFSSKPKTNKLSANNIRDQITQEFKNVSEQVIKIILEYFEGSEKSFSAENTQNHLAESLLGAFAEYTDKILLWI